METLKYGTKIKVLNGMFEGCNGIFFSNLENDRSKIEVFFETKAIECPENTKDYFKDYLLNENIPKKMTSVLVNISKKDIIKG